MSINPDLLIQQPAVEAGVSALAARNQHHFSSMTEDERMQAVAHWRELAIDVLGAARAAVSAPRGPDTPVEDGSGRAIIVLEDAGGQDVVVNVSFEPDLEDVGNGEVAGTPAQIMALSLLDTLEGDQPPPEVA